METTISPTLSILDQFTPHILGVFWFTNEDLGRELSGFDDLNYLFDGLISQYIYGKEKAIRHAHIFFTKNFNEKIFLTHLKTQELNKAQVMANIHDHIILIEGSKKDLEEKRKTILVLDKTHHEFILELKKNYPHFEFQALSL